MVTLLYPEAAGESKFDPLKAFFHPAGSRLQVFLGTGPGISKNHLSVYSRCVYLYCIYYRHHVSEFVTAPSI